MTERFSVTLPWGWRQSDLLSRCLGAGGKVTDCQNAPGLEAKWRGDSMSHCPGAGDKVTERLDVTLPRGWKQSNGETRCHAAPWLEAK